MAASVAQLIVNKYPSGLDSTQRRIKVYGKLAFGAVAQDYVVGGTPLVFSPLYDESGAEVVLGTSEVYPKLMRFEDHSGTGYIFQYNEQIAPVATISTWAITSNVITFTANNALLAGSVVTIQGLVQGSFLNGQQFVVLSTSLSSSVFKVAFTHANVSTVTEPGIAVPATSCPISAWSVTSNVVTFTTLGASFYAGQVITVQGLVTGAAFNGKPLVVLSTNLSSIVVEADFTTSLTSATENGTLINQPTVQIFQSGAENASAAPLVEYTATTLPSSVSEAIINFEADFLKAV